MIFVWHCCGKFSDMIPWSDWMSREIWPYGYRLYQEYPTDYVFLYSVRGQTLESARTALRRAAAINERRSVSLDGFLCEPSSTSSASGHSIDWDDVLTAILTAAAAPKGATDAETRRRELLADIDEADRVLQVFWSSIPISRTHQRCLDWKQDLKRELAELGGTG